MSLCIFCFRPFSKDNRKTVEHVLRRAWIEALGHSETGMAERQTRNGQVLVQTAADLSALALVTGKVCAQCNNGWMNDLDCAVDREILGLARGELTLDALDEHSRFRLSRWLLKTTITFRCGAAPDFRHLPDALRESCKRPDFLPRGFISFAAVLQPGARGLAASSLDEWLYIASPGAPNSLHEMPQSQRTKAAFRFDRLVIGCAWVSVVGTPCFLTIPDVHHVLFLNEATFKPHPDDEIQIVEHFANLKPSNADYIQVALGWGLNPD